MEYTYYIIEKDSMKIIDGAADVVSTLNLAENYGKSVIIMQGCAISEIDVPEQSIPPQPQHKKDDNTIVQDNEVIYEDLDNTDEDV